MPWLALGTSVAPALFALYLAAAIALSLATEDGSEKDTSVPALGL